jgi:diguanylate cyclase
MTGRNHDYTFKIAEETLDRIKALGLPADPAGFELWYTYVTGANEPLNRCINAAIEERGTLSIEECEKIQEAFAPHSRMSSAVGHVSTKVSAEIDHIVEMLSELILSTAQGRQDCIKASRKLENEADRDTICAISDTLIESLRVIELQHAALEQQLIASKAEVEAANHALAMVTAQANMDSVTGLANRRGFDAALQRAAERTGTDGAAPFCLLMIDIDHFKLFNDRLGHLMGDTVLRLISAMLRQSVKADDFVARYGGEEFAIILPDADFQGAVAIAEQIRLKIMSRELKKRSTGEALGKITVSIGIAAFRPGDRARSVVERADAQLYDAKHSGRNCTRCEPAVAPLAQVG